MNTKRRAIALSITLLGCGVLSLASLVACSDTSTAPPARTLKAASHTCTEKEPGPPLTCETAAPGPCNAPATACWIIGNAYPQGFNDAGSPVGPSVGAVCPGCCNGMNASATAVSCIPIACTTANDCPIESSTCTQGYCSP